MCLYKPSCEGLSLDGRVVLVRNILPPDQTPMQALQSLGESEELKLQRSTRRFWFAARLRYSARLLVRS